MFVIRSKKRKRFLNGDEMLASLGYPSTPRMANDLGTVSCLMMFNDGDSH